MAKSVTLKQFSEWLQQIEHRTWSHRWFLPHKFPEIDREGKKHTREVKYFYPKMEFSLDTRDWRVFHIQTRDPELQANQSDDFEGTILELLETKMDKKFQWEEDEYNKEKLKRSVPSS